MSIKKCSMVVIFVLTIILTSTTRAQSVITDNEIKEQLKMIAELEKIRSENSVLLQQKATLEQTLSLNEKIIILKDTQIKTLLEVIEEYIKLKDMYNSQIEFQKGIIENSNKIIEIQNKVNKKNTTLDTIKSVLYAILGVVIGSKL